MKKRIKIGIVGNPNCGKTTLFNQLTGTKQRVGNWPGVTVDKKIGNFVFNSIEIEVIDTPGIYSMSASSLDERITRDFVLSKEADLIINIVDASNIERNLYLTIQLLEMQVPIIIALNMIDVAEKKGLKIDHTILSNTLCCDIIPIVASKGIGIKKLKNAILNAISKTSTPICHITFHETIEQGIKKLSTHLESIADTLNVPSRWLGIKLLENDPDVLQLIKNSSTKKILTEIQSDIKKQTGEEPDIFIASGRYSFIGELIKKSISSKRKIGEGISDKVDKIVLNRVLGIPIFLFAMYLMLLFVINIGGAFIDFFDIISGALFVEIPRQFLKAINTPHWIITILAEGIGGGIQTLATFIPPIGFMFVCLALLEDSGYMARAAFVMDRFMRFIGLPGKSFVPMLVGFGCNVPAIMATRTLENERDRLLTIAMNPFMSCGARLPVYALFATTFFPSNGQNLVFFLYLIGIGAAVFTGLIFKNTLLRGDITPFIMELPPYHLPTLKSVMLRAFDRLKAFLFRAGKVLIPVITILVFLNSFGIDGTFGNENTPKSILSSIGKNITPVFSPMGICKENWPATVGIFTGIFAKEAVVGTLNSLYSPIGIKAKDEANVNNILESFKEASLITLKNLKDITNNFLNPLGISINISDRETLEKESSIRTSTLVTMQTLFGSTAAAFSYLLFILLYFPCSAAIAAIYRETNIAWTLFIGFWTTFLAWSIATGFYQIATINDHFYRSILWLLAIGMMNCIIIGVLYIVGQKQNSTPIFKVKTIA